MWIEDVKDGPMIREVVEIAGRDRLDQERRRGLAMAIVKAAETRGVDVPASLVDALTLYADDDQMQVMISDIVADPQAPDGDVAAFVRERGVDLPGYGS